MHLRYYSSFLLPVILLYLFPLKGSAQTNKQDVVYLKNGSSIRGKLIIDSTVVKIQTSDNSVWAFNRGDVDSIKKEPRHARSYLMTRQKGYYNVSVAGANIPPPDISTIQGLALSMSNGYRFSPYFSVGGVVGLDVFEQDIYLPVSLECRGEIIRRSATPFWFAQYGYPLIQKLNKSLVSYDPGRSLAAGGGMLFVLSSNVNLVMQLSFKAQKGTYERFSWRRGDYIETIDYRRTCLQIGLQF
jgi:hypothetical protein